MKIYVGNMSYEVKEDDLREAFGKFGQVESVTIIMDKFSGRSKGFGFVEMSSREAGQAAIEGMNGKDMKGRAINVNEARPPEKRSDRGGFGGDRGGGRGGHGGGGGFSGGRGGGKSGFSGGGKSGGYSGGGRRGSGRGGDR